MNGYIIVGMAADKTEVKELIQILKVAKVGYMMQHLYGEK